MSGAFAGRAALVTGGAKGIGAAIVRALACEGARVVFIDRDATAGAELSRETGAAFAEADVADYPALQHIVGAHGPFDSLVNNAGVDQHAFFTETKPDDWGRLVGINLGSVFGTTHLVLPGMQRAEFGRSLGSWRTSMSGRDARRRSISSRPVTQPI